MARENIKICKHPTDTRNPYRVYVRGNILRDARAPFAIRLFSTSRTAFAAGLGAEAHAMENHAKWEADKATADREGISVPEAARRRILAGG